MSRYIDADKLKNHYAWWSNENEYKEVFDSIIDAQPTADVVEVVRCKECVNYKATDTGCWCDLALNLNDAAVTPEHYCAKGERQWQNT